MATEFSAASYEDLSDPENLDDAADLETNEKPKGSYTTWATSSFKDFAFDKPLMKAIEEAGFEHPSEVQHEGIPKAIIGQDMIVQAKSGMGKTAVFVISTLSQIEATENVVDTIVLCHTREMAVQIAGEFERFGQYMTVQIGVVYGGVPFDESRNVIEEEKPHVLIGTPGRVMHLLEEGVLDLSHVNRFVLDECDNMLDQLDMRRQVQNIFKRTPHRKQVMMFSATISEESRRVCRKFTKNAQEIFVDDNKLTLHGLQQHFIQLVEKRKNAKLNDLLDALDFNQVVIFVSTCKRAELLCRVMRESGFPAVFVHSRMEQARRLALFQEFKQFRHRIMVATNLLGRGVDFERINIVVNYDMPRDADEYLHRVGRAGRFGTKGLAVTFVAQRDDEVVLSSIQERFAVEITPLPNEIDTTSYM